jgi:hypothetical protein
MRRIKAIATSAALAVVFGGASVLAGAVANVSATPGSVSVIQGGTGQFWVTIDSLSGSVPPKAKNAPTVSYCQEWTIHTDGTATCEATGYFTLDRGRNYTQSPVGVGEYAGAVVVNVDSGVPCSTVVNLTETFTVQAGSGLDFGSDVLQVSRTVAVTVLCETTPVFGGCSHGYWKNHLSEWPAPYNASTKLGDVFNLATFTVLSEVTLKDALEFSGGRTNLDKAKILLRNAVASLLNAAKIEITYSLTTSQLSSDVSAALASNNADTMLSLEKQLDAANHGSPYCGDSVQ